MVEELAHGDLTVIMRYRGFGLPAETLSVFVKIYIFFIISVSTA